ncbi:ATP-dependent DNA helicase pfh1 [Colletotrichum fructicola Nara gc5]|uniref:ATP-dependent DNA helicase n=1 Tax=Colletotrichum fructicola (strain Nara gc5) TaxID=1213859 RepID=A0A7J6IPQ4_COLFN|nr:ATP-dependent DNA helicase pfh1 [Colletotrichum fructicola Nara gc5]
MVEFTDFPRNRKRSRGRSRSNHPAKRQRRYIPPAEYIPIDNHDGPTNATTIYQNNRAISQRSHDASQLRSNGRPSANSSKDPIQAEVNRLLAEYTRGLPPDLYASGKKKAYYIVWKGHQCGIYTNWADCQAQTNGVSKAGFVGTKTFSEAVRDPFPEVALLEANAQPIPYTPAANTSHFPNPNSYAAPTTPAERVAATATEVPIKHEPEEDFTAFPVAPAASVEVAVTEIPMPHEPKQTEAPDKPILCPEQQEAMDLAMQGHNLFITGSGGCGKSVLVKALRDEFRSREMDTHLLAPTGQAVVNIGGRTTFNYAGWTPSDLAKPLNGKGGLVEKARSKKIFTRIDATDVIIIDEISMVENHFFERLSRIMSIIRSDPKPFGGVQDIVVGDFCQLPPVMPFKNCMECGSLMNKKSRISSCSSYPHEHGRFSDDDKWAFKSPEWSKCNFKYVHFKQIHRQQDEAFVSVLQKCRLGKPLSKPDINLLLAHETDLENCTELYALRKEVEMHNNKENQKNKNKARRYFCLDDFCGPKNSDGGYALPEEFHDYTVLNLTAMAPTSQRPLKCLDDHRYAMCSELKLDMPVILLANIDLGAGLCNSRQGKIIGFKPLTEMPKQPSRQNYKHNPDGFEVAQHRYDHMMDFIASKATPREFPEVEFTNGIRRIIGPDTTANNIGRTSPYWLLSRTQIPLIPGWSMTIHKSQSLTLDRVTANLSKVFETGQAYVALSRARSLKGLKIKGCTMAQLRDCMKVDPVVKGFMDRMEAVESRETAETRPSMRDRFIVKREETAASRETTETIPSVRDMRDRFFRKREEAVEIKEEPQGQPAFFFDLQGE